MIWFRQVTAARLGLVCHLLSRETGTQGCTRGKPYLFTSSQAGLLGRQSCSFLPASLLTPLDFSASIATALAGVSSLLSQVPFLFSSLVFLVSVCVCAQCVFTVTKAHFQTPTPVVTDTLRVPMAGLAFSHQVSPYWEEGDIIQWYLFI